jgi:hypothetical protein
VDEAGSGLVAVKGPLATSAPADADVTSLRSLRHCKFQGIDDSEMSAAPEELIAVGFGHERAIAWIWSQCRSHANGTTIFFM